MASHTLDADEPAPSATRRRIAPPRAKDDLLSVPTPRNAALSHHVMRDEYAFEEAIKDTQSLLCAKRANAAVNDDVLSMVRARLIVPALVAIKKEYRNGAIFMDCCLDDFRWNIITSHPPGIRSNWAPRADGRLMTIGGGLKPYVVHFSRSCATFERNSLIDRITTTPRLSDPPLFSCVPGMPGVLIISYCEGYKSCILTNDDVVTCISPPHDDELIGIICAYDFSSQNYIGIMDYDEGWKRPFRTDFYDPHTDKWVQTEAMVRAADTSFIPSVYDVKTVQQRPTAMTWSLEPAVGGKQPMHAIQLDTRTKRWNQLADVFTVPADGYESMAFSAMDCTDEMVLFVDNATWAYSFRANAWRQEPRLVLPLRPYRRDLWAGTRHRQPVPDSVWMMNE